MAVPDEVALWRASRQDEVDSAHVYRALARHRSGGELYARLAAAEESHAARCVERLRALGAEIDDVRPTRRARILASLGRRFGPRFVLAALVRDEGAAELRYDTLGEDGAEIAEEESDHAAVLRSGLPESASRHPERHRLGAGNTLRASVLGANDGLLSNFSLVMGVAGAQLSRTSVLITGLSGLLAGAGSMALGEWISVQSSREYEEHELEVERRELELDPAGEREELAAIYSAKGLSDDDAERMAEAVLADPARALDTMAREELGIDPEARGGSPWNAAISSFVLFAVGAILPILPYFFVGGLVGIAASTALSALGLFGIGAAITLVTARSWLRSGLRQVAFGLAAAALTFAVGRLLGTTVA
jgi:VIT1/CCC1 family predicted Fe2+/Mn2+ transporter